MTASVSASALWRRSGAVSATGGCILLSKEGMHMNQKRFRRLYREEGLAVRKRGGRKRALGQRAPLGLP
jgi:hypothetical protein